MPTHIKWDEIFLNFFYWNNAPFVMTPDDHQTPTSISHEKWEVPWVFFHILIVQGIYLYNIKVIEPLTSALIFFLYVYKKRKNGKKKWGTKYLSPGLPWQMPNLSRKFRWNPLCILKNMAFLIFEVRLVGAMKCVLQHQYLENRWRSRKNIWHFWVLYNHHWYTGKREKSLTVTSEIAPFLEKMALKHSCKLK